MRDLFSHSATMIPKTQRLPVLVRSYSRPIRPDWQQWQKVQKVWRQELVMACNGLYGNLTSTNRTILFTIVWPMTCSHLLLVRRTSGGGRFFFWTQLQHNWIELKSSFRTRMSSIIFLGCGCTVSSIPGPPKVDDFMNAERKDGQEPGDTQEGNRRSTVLFLYLFFQRIISLLLCWLLYWSVVVGRCHVNLELHFFFPKRPTGSLARGRLSDRRNSCFQVKWSCGKLFAALDHTVA